MVLEEYKTNKKEAVKDLVIEVKKFFKLIHHDEFLETQNKLMHEFSHSINVQNDREYIETIQISLEISTFLSALYKKYMDIDNAENLIK
jgi:hypothetical protein